MSKRPRAARSTKHQRPARPSGAPTRPVAPVTPRAAAAVATAEPETAPAEPRPAPVRPQPRASGKPSGLLAAKAANEYVYVAQDLRRIGTFAAAVAAIMVVVWVLVDLAHVIVL